MLPLERALIAGEPVSEAPTPRLLSMAQCISAGEWLRALESEPVTSVLKADVQVSSVADLCLDLKDRVLDYLTASDDAGPSTLEKQLSVLLAGIACLNLFVQANWTGPPVQAPATPLPQWTAALDRAPDAGRWHDDMLRHLSRDGEDAWTKQQYPAYFIVAHVLLVGCGHALRLCASAAWWRMRVHLRHQELLSNPAPSVREPLLEAMQDAVLRNDSPADPMLAAQVQLESALVHWLYRNRRAAHQAVLAAQERVGLQVEVVGVMGRRTKHQENDTAQLVLQARARHGSGVAPAPSPAPAFTVQPVVPPAAAAAAADEAAPAAAVAAAATGDADAAAEPTGYEGIPARVAAGVQEIGLDDQDVLTRPAFMDAEGTADASLHPLHQAILLGLCMDVKNNNPSHGLTAEQMMPYLDRVAGAPQSHAVHSMCLLQRSRLEMERSRVRERGALQIQALVDQYRLAHTADAAARLRHLYMVAWPLRRELQAELARMMLGVGAAATAFELFMAVDMWEQAADCLVVAGKEARAKQLVLQELEKRRTPRLLCLLGDLTGEPRLFEEAWQLSGGRFSLAKRMHGNFLVRQKDWAGCIPHYEAALAINFLFPRTWFTLGCAYMHLGDFEKAATAFTRVVHQDPEEADAWSNLGSAMLSMGKKREALKCLQEAVKLKPDNSRLWDNLVLIAMDVGEVQAAIHGMRRVLEITHNQVNWKVLSVLVRVGGGGADVFSNDAQRRTYLRLLGELLNDIGVALPGTPDTWLHYAEYYALLGDQKSILECRLRQHRSVQRAGWDRDPDLFPDVARVTCRVADAYAMLGDRGSLDSAAGILDLMIKRASVLFAEHPATQEMREKAVAIQALLRTAPASADAAGRP